MVPSGARNNRWTTATVAGTGAAAAHRIVAEEANLEMEVGIAPLIENPSYLLTPFHPRSDDDGFGIGIRSLQMAILGVDRAAIRKMVLDDDDPSRIVVFLFTNHLAVGGGKNRCPHRARSPGFALSRNPPQVDAGVRPGSELRMGVVAVVLLDVDIVPHGEAA